MRKNSINKSTKNGVVYRNIFISRHATAIYFREAETRSCPHHSRYRSRFVTNSLFTLHRARYSTSGISSGQPRAKIAAISIEIWSWNTGTNYMSIARTGKQDEKKEKTQNKIKNNLFNDKLVFSRYAHGGSRKDTEWQIPQIILRVVPLRGSRSWLN